MKIAKILSDLLNKLFGRKQDKVEKVVHDVNVNITAGSDSETTIMIQMDEDCPEKDDETTAPFPKDEIMREIKRLIKGEDKNKPLYDTEIHALLQKAGFDLVSRTVGRYRNELDIEPRKERLEEYRKEARKRNKKRQKKDKDCD